MLNMPIKEIKENISLREEYWENNFETNCYAFASLINESSENPRKKYFYRENQEVIKVLKKIRN